jgi:hypothetical protein
MAAFVAARPFLGEATVDAYLARLQAPLRIALSGTLKSGKSTLLNALLGEEVAATDATECTRVVTTYRYAPTPVVEIVPDGGRRTALPPAAIGGTALVPEEIEIGLPSRLLARWTLVDTPGTSSTTGDVSARTLAYLDPDDGVCDADASST